MKNGRRKASRDQHIPPPHRRRDSMSAENGAHLPASGHNNHTRLFHRFALIAQTISKKCDASFQLQSKFNGPIITKLSSLCKCFLYLPFSVCRSIPQTCQHRAAPSLPNGGPGRFAVRLAQSFRNSGRFFEGYLCPAQLCQRKQSDPREDSHMWTM